MKARDLVVDLFTLDAIFRHVEGTAFDDVGWPDRNARGDAHTVEEEFLVSLFGSVFIESVADKNSSDRGVGILSFGAHGDGRSFAGREHHQTHDRGAADFRPAVANANGRLVIRGHFNEFRGGAREDRVDWR